MDGEATCVLDAKATLGEGPVWDDRESVLWWVDIDGCAIHRYDPATDLDTHCSVGEKVGAAVPRAKGGLVAAVVNGFVEVDFDKASVNPVVDPEAGSNRNRFNDGKCDPAGRFWAGTMNVDGSGPVGALYRLDADRTVHTMVTGVGTSNGLAWSTDGDTMYYIDTPTRRVDAFDYDVKTGEIRNRRKVVEIPDGQGYPDGMSIDDEGKLWVAHWGGWRVARWDPNTGQKLGEIKLPAAHVTSCAFGGPHRKTLYITTARTGLNEAGLKEQPLAGGVFAIELTVSGPPFVPYAG